MQTGKENIDVRSIYKVDVTATRPYQTCTFSDQISTAIKTINRSGF